jgi:ABC-2 type transport system ATP-binding protein
MEDQITVFVRAAHVTAEVARGLSRWSPSVCANGDRMTLSVSSGAMVPEIVHYLVANRAEIYEVTPQRLSLEERFLEIVGSDGGL